MNSNNPYPQIDQNRLQFTPVKNGGISFCNAKLDTSNESIYKIKFTKTNFISYFIILAFFIGFFIIGLNYQLPLLFLGVLSFVFLVIITCLVIKILNLPQFNFYTNCCKIGRKEIPFNDIIALQIIGETVTHKKRSYISYELNILRSNYTRVNLLDHGNLKQLTNDAILLSNALNVPVISLEDYPSCKKQLEEYYKNKQVKSLVIVSCVFACFSLLLFTIGVIIPVVKSLQTNNWVEVDAKVVESYVRTYTNKKRQKTYSLNLRAQYTYNNRSYTCSKYSYLDSSSRSSLNKIVRANPVGKKIKCYVNSNNPNESIISRAISIREALSVVFISLVLGSLSSLLFFFRHKIANPNKGKIKTIKLSLFSKKAPKKDK